MGIHAERVHETFVEGCAACRWASVVVAADAVPTRKPDVVEGARKDRALERDMREFKTLVKQGIMPPQVRGSAERARTARTADDVVTPHPGKNKGKPLGVAIERRSERNR